MHPISDWDPSYFQEHPDGTFPVAYISCRLSRAEANYSVVERECPAVVWAVSKFYCYLYGQGFVLQSDHRPVTFMDKVKITNAMGIVVTAISISC